MHSDWWKFKERMMPGTRPPVRYIRLGEEGVRASDLGPSKNQATPGGVLPYTGHIGMCCPKGYGF